MIDREQVYKWWNIFQHNGSKFCEIRCIDGKKTYSGYYKSIDNLIRDIEPISERPNMQIYFVLNTINDDCYVRQQCEHLVEMPKNTTSDNDIQGRDFILLDFDPKRPSGVGSTNEQLEKARVVARKVYDFLIAQGLNEPIVACSGNGWHLIESVSLANNTENTKLIERFLKSISMLFSTEEVDIDLKVFNAARICKLYGTYAKKGTNSQSHPWRLSKIVKCPEEVKPTQKDYIDKIANLYVDEPPQKSKENFYGNSKFDIKDFFSRHNIEYRETHISGGVRYILKECPFGGHKDPDSMVFQHDNGALAFMCYHNSCSQYRWRDFRLHFEPDAYDKKDYKDFQAKVKYYDRYAPQQVEIKQENQADGKKWLDWDDIKDIRDEDLIAIRSGIFAIDKLMKGFILQEVSVLCGLNGSGKSTILNTFALNAIQRGYKTAIFSGELRPQRLKQWIAQCAAGKMNVIKSAEGEKSYDVSPSAMPLISHWLNGNIKFYSHEKYGNLGEQLLNDINECIDKYDVKFILLDNLMTISLDGESGDLNAKQKSFVIKLTQLAKTKNVHIILVVHPRKEQGLTFIRKESVKGAGDITDAIDNLFLIHKVDDDFQKRAQEFLGKERVAELMCYNNVLEIAKNRDYGWSNKFIGLYFEPETRRFKNSVSETIHYAWEPDTSYQTYAPQPTQQLQPNTGFDTPKSFDQEQTSAYDAQFAKDDNLPF